MNGNTMLCDDHKLKQLLTVADNDIEHDEWLEHVDHCGKCQSRLRDLAADDADWRMAAMVLSTNVEDAAFPRQRRESTSTWNEAMVSQLLDAPSHPEMLGRLGRYEIERMIGSGGMGIVFKAFDTELNRVVAIKLLAPYLAANGSATKRFAREARAAAGVRDDHVVPIYNVECEHEPPFLVMQYVAGGSLQEKLDRDGPLDVPEVLRIGLQTAAGLAAAHAQGLIHRDVKPSNILLDESVERALLTDFGLARAENEACLTRSGFHPGTPHYMSPEQVRGESIDSRSDLFGLGCVLYALCTSHPPFRAETSFAVMRQITDEVPKPIRDVNPNFPVWLDRIVMKLLAQSRGDRFSSAENVADLLKACLAHVQQPENVALPTGVTALVDANAKTVPATDSEDDEPTKARVASAGEVKRRPPLKKLLIALAFAIPLLLAGALIIIESGKGTITIESEVDNVPVVIRKGGKFYDELTVSKSGTSLRVYSGEYEIEFGRRRQSIGKTFDAAKLDAAILGADREQSLSAADRDLLRTDADYDRMVTRDLELAWRSEISRPDWYDRLKIENKSIVIGRGEKTIVRICLTNTPEEHGEKSRDSGKLDEHGAKSRDSGKLEIQSKPSGVSQVMDDATVQVQFTGPQGMNLSPIDVSPSTSSRRDAPLVCPVRIDLRQGMTHKLLVTDVPNFAGAEFLASVEFRRASEETQPYLDHNAVPISLASADFEQVLNNKLLTKVIYLSDEVQRGVVNKLQTVVSNHPDSTRAVAKADERGKIVAVLKIGNRRIEPIEAGGEMPAETQSQKDANRRDSLIGTWRQAKEPHTEWKFLEGNVAQWHFDSNGEERPMRCRYEILSDGRLRLTPISNPFVQKASEVRYVLENHACTLLMEIEKGRLDRYYRVTEPSINLDEHASIDPVIRRAAEMTSTEYSGYVVRKAFPLGVPSKYLDRNPERRNAKERVSNLPGSFAARLDALRQTTPLDSGHANVVAEYKTLLQDFPEHSQRAEALFDLAHLWELTIPGQKIVPDQAKVVRLLREAHAAADPDSSVWMTSALHLHSRIFREHPEKAQQLVDALLRSDPSPADRMRILNARQRVAVFQNDDPEVEHIGRTMLNQMDSYLTEPGAKYTLLYKEAESGICSMLNYWQQNDKSWKLAEFKKDYGPFIDRFLEATGRTETSATTPEHE